MLVCEKCLAQFDRSKEFVNRTQSLPRSQTVLAFILCVLLQTSITTAAAGPAVPILVYHRFAFARTDTMTVTTAHFKEQMELLAENGFSVIPLADFVAWRMKKGPAPPGPFCCSDF